MACERFGKDGNGVSVGQVSRLLGVSDGSVINFTNRVIVAILNVKDRFMRWPDSIERERISDYFGRTKGFYGCVGLLDGTLVVLAQAPHIDPSSYWSRKQNYSINVQVFCDHEGIIRDLIIGWPGSVHDARAWAACDQAKHPSRYFSDGQYLLGDSAYPLTKGQMLVPYKAPASQDANNSKFNEKLSSCRVGAEHVMGKIKGRWCSLKGLRPQVKTRHDFGRLNGWVAACGVLHNMMYWAGDGDVPDDPNPIDTQLDNGERDNVPSGGEVHKQWREEIKAEVLGL